MAGQVEAIDFRVLDFDPLWIFVFVQLCTHLEPGFRRGRRDQLNDGAKAAQRLASPIDRDEREQTMLYLVPLRSTWRQVADRDGQLELVRQLLKLNFPQTDTISVAATTVSRNPEALGVRVTLLSHRPPPAADRINGKGGGVVIGTDADPSSVVGDVVDAVRHGALQFGTDEVVNIAQFRRALPAPFPAVVLEIAHQFLLFCINRYERFVRRQERHGLRVDVSKL